MMLRLKTLMFALAIAGSVVFVDSCKKPDSPTSNNNNTNTNNNNNTNNPKGPTLKLVYPTKDTFATPFDFVQFEIIATPQPGTTLKSVVRHDGIDADTTLPNIIDPTQNPAVLDDIYFIPKGFTVGTITVKYTVTDDKGNSNSVSRNISIGAKPKTFALYKNFVIYDQNRIPLVCFLNTGGTPTDKTPQLLTPGEVNPPNLANRKLVDFVCLQTAGQPDILCAPWYEAFDSIPMFHNLWADADRNKTDMRKLSGFDVLTCTAATIKTAFDAAKGPAYHPAWIFSPGDVYAFKTVDGRYGAFVVVAFGGGIKMHLAVESR